MVQDVRRGAGPGGPGRTIFFFSLKVSVLFFFFLRVLCHNPPPKKKKFRARPVQDLWLCAGPGGPGRFAEPFFSFLLVFFFFLLSFFLVVCFRCWLAPGPGGPGRPARRGNPGGPGRTRTASVFFIFFVLVVFVCFLCLVFLCRWLAVLPPLFCFSGFSLVCFFRFCLGVGRQDFETQNGKPRTKKQIKKKFRARPVQDLWLCAGPGGPGRPRNPFFGFCCFDPLFFFFWLVGYGPGWSRTSGETRAPAVRDVQGRSLFCFFLGFFFPCCVWFAGWFFFWFVLCFFLFFWFSFCFFFVFYFFGLRSQDPRKKKKKKQKKKTNQNKNKIFKGPAGPGRPARRGPRRSGTCAETLLLCCFMFFLGGRVCFLHLFVFVVLLCLICTVMCCWLVKGPAGPGRPARRGPQRSGTSAEPKPFSFCLCYFVFFLCCCLLRFLVIWSVLRCWLVTGPGGPGCPARREPRRSGTYRFFFFFCSESLGSAFLFYFLAGLVSQPPTKKKKTNKQTNPTTKTRKHFKARPVQDLWLGAGPGGPGRFAEPFFFFFFFGFFFFLSLCVFAAGWLRARVVRDVRRGAGPGGPGRTGRAFFLCFRSCCVCLFSLFGFLVSVACGFASFVLFFWVFFGLFFFVFVWGFGRQNFETQNGKPRTKKKTKKKFRARPVQDLWLCAGPGGPGRPRNPFFGFCCFDPLFFFFWLVGYGPGWSTTSGETRAPAVRDVQGRSLFCFFLGFFFCFPCCVWFAGWFFFWFVLCFFLFFWFSFCFFYVFYFFGFRSQDPRKKKKKKKKTKKKNQPKQKQNL